MVFHLDRFCFCTSAFPVCDRYLNLPRFIGRCKKICTFFLCSFPLYFITPDRKSTRLNSSHVAISYAVFCLKKKNVCTGDREIVRSSTTVTALRTHGNRIARPPVRNSR